MGEIEPSQTKGDLALKAKGEPKSKKKNKGKAPQSSSSEVSDDSSDEEDHKANVKVERTYTCT